MNRVIVEPGHALQGQITLPGDKSISHRVALFSAIAEGKCRIKNFLFAGVTEVMLKALSQLGIRFEMDRDALIIDGQGLSGLTPPDKPIDCGNSATTLRLLAGLLAAAGIPAVLDGTESLRRRPMRRIVDPLIAMGVPITASKDGTAPLRLEARSSAHKLKGLDYRSPVASAQVKSTLLLASLAAEGPCRFYEPGPSRDHTELLMNGLGIEVETQQLYEKSGSERLITFTPAEHIRIPAFDMAIPGDFSSAAFMMVGASICPGSHVELARIGLNPTRTGLLDALISMGGDIRITRSQTQFKECVGNVLIDYGNLHGSQISGDLVVRMIDEFPAFATAGVYAKGSTSVSEALELRNKESDRIASLVHEFKSLGAQINEEADGFSISGNGTMPAGQVHPHGDHRLAMALTIAGLAANGSVTVCDADVISESYPGFFTDLQSLGAVISLLED